MATNAFKCILTHDAIINVFNLRSAHIEAWDEARSLVVLRYLDGHESKIGPIETDKAKGMIMDVWAAVNSGD